MIADVLYFPLDNGKPGVIVAVTDRSMDKYENYMAYISLETRRLIKSYYFNYPITTLCAIIDGLDDRNQFTRLAMQFRNVLLIGLFRPVTCLCTGGGSEFRACG